MQFSYSIDKTEVDFWIGQGDIDDYQAILLLQQKCSSERVAELMFFENFFEKHFRLVNDAPKNIFSGPLIESTLYPDTAYYYNLWMHQNFLDKLRNGLTVTFTKV